MSQADVMVGLKSLSRAGIGAPLLLVMMLAMMVLPLPPFLLDIFFTFNISLSLVVLLSGVYSKKPLDFSSFPTILLVATLLRIALNVASPRVVVFAILVIVNFVVATKGAGRISEVSARCTLDAMPGKQMAIDADLNAGLITQAEAKARRQEVSREADFYGSMDGASKFVRGDAIAGILILFINLIGGLVIGMLQHGMSFADAMHNYSLLTIGDGLVAQVPTQVLSTAAAMLVTRVSSSEDMGQQILDQLFANPKSLVTTSDLG